MLTCRFVQFRPSEAVCTCNDRELNGICCHLLAASRHPDLEGQCAPLSSQPSSQVALGGGVSYEQPTCEPLGDSLGQELQRIRQTGEEGRRALGQQQTNADPFTAEVHSLCSIVKRSLLSMPAGEDSLQPTAKRAGKQLAKRLSRPENRNKEVPLFPGRSKSSKASAHHQHPPGLAPLPKLAKKGRPSTKVREWAAKHLLQRLAWQH